MGNTPFPVSVALADADGEAAFDNEKNERPSVSELRTAIPTVALLVADPSLRNQLAVLMQVAGLLPMGEELFRRQSQ